MKSSHNQLHLQKRSNCMWFHSYFTHKHNTQHIIQTPMLIQASNFIFFFNSYKGCICSYHHIYMHVLLLQQSCSHFPHHTFVSGKHRQRSQPMWPISRHQGTFRIRCSRCRMSSLIRNRTFRCSKTWLSDFRGWIWRYLLWSVWCCSPCWCHSQRWWSSYSNR